MLFVFTMLLSATAANASIIDPAHNSSLRETMISSPDTAITQYLESAVRGDFNTLSSLSNDARYSNDYQKEALYEQTLDNSSKKPISYQIINSNPLDGETHQYLVELRFENSGVSNIPFVLKNSQFGWKVNISKQSIDEKPGYSLINEGNVAMPRAAFAAVSNASCKWNFWGRVDGRTFDSKCSGFSINAPSLKVLLNLQQYNDKGDSYEPMIKYEIVESNWWSDDTWGYTDIIGTKKGKAYQEHVYGDKQTATDVYIRFTTHDTSPDVVTTLAGFGELYDS